MLTQSLRRQEAANESGFSLVELLVVLLIMGVIGAFTLNSLVQGMQVSNEADRRVQALTDLQQAGQRVSRELRMACRVETAEPDEVVLHLLRDAGTHYRYRISVDADGVLVGDVDTVAADGTTTTHHRTDRIARDIVNGDALFTYADATGFDEGNDVPAPQVRDIRLTLRREAPDDVVEWTGDLHLRNGGLSCGF